MDDKHHSAKDVPVATNVGASTSSTPTTATAVDLYTRRSCPRCGRRMSSLQFDKHTFCVICRDVKCSLATRCKECKAWSKEFMLGYVKHQRSLVMKEKRITPSSSPPPPVTVVATTSLDTSPSELFSEDRLRQLMHSMFRDLMPASIGTNPSSTAPPAVTDSATKYTEATWGGLQSVMPFEAPTMESPGVVLPTTQVDLPPPHNVSVCVSCVDSSGFSNLGGPINSGVGLTISVSSGTDQLRVVNVATALSPGSLLFPFSDSGFASLSASSSSRPFALPPSSSFLFCGFIFFFDFFLGFVLFLFLFLLLLFLLLPLFLLLWLLLLLLFFLAPLFRLWLLFVLLLGLLLLLVLLLFLLRFLLLFPLPLSRRRLPSLRSPLLFLLAVSPFRLASLLRFSPLPLPQLDFASYQASMLGLSQDYQSLARWYFLSGGLDFRAYLSAFYPHLSSDASRDFSSGSCVFFSALRAVASSVPLPAVSSAAPPLPSVASASTSCTPAPLPLPAPVSAPYGVTVPPLSLPPVSQLGGGLYALGAVQILPQAPPGVSSLSAASPLLSVSPPTVPSASRPPGVSTLYPPASSTLPAASFAWPVSSAPGLGSPPLVSLAPSLPAVPPPAAPVFTAASALPRLRGWSLRFCLDFSWPRFWFRWLCSSTWPCSSCSSSLRL